MDQVQEAYILVVVVNFQIYGFLQKKTWSIRQWAFSRSLEFRATYWNETRCHELVRSSSKPTQNSCHQILVIIGWSRNIHLYGMGFIGLTVQVYTLRNCHLLKAPVKKISLWVIVLYLYFKMKVKSTQEASSYKIYVLIYPSIKTWQSQTSPLTLFLAIHVSPMQPVILAVP